MPIIRTDEFPRTGDGSDSRRRADAVGQWEWCRLIPTLHRALANPAEDLHFPRFRRDFALDEACAYWETAWYLLRRLVGWPDVGAGLQWWFREGKPIEDDPRLRLLAELFDDRRQLELLAMWAWTQELAAEPARTPEAFAGAEFFAAFLVRHPGYGIAHDHDPFHGGSNPLHLGHSCLDEPAPDDTQILRGDPARRRAVLVVDEARCWHAALKTHGRALPDLGEGSWHVDVHARAIGSLGVFRRSRVTGEWFQGRHSIHERGARRSA